jgi:hypothetical protein
MGITDRSPMPPFTMEGGLREFETWHSDSSGEARFQVRNRCSQKSNGGVRPARIGSRYEVRQYATIRSAGCKLGAKREGCSRRR